MHFNRLFIEKNRTWLFGLLLCLPMLGWSQHYYLPLNEYQVLVQESEILEDTALAKRFHSSVKPYVASEYLQKDTPEGEEWRTMEKGMARNKSWVLDKLTNSPAVNLRHDEFRLVAHPIVSVRAGRSLSESANLYKNTRGVRAYGTVVDKVSFATTFYENQSVEPGYINSWIFKNRVMPGQGRRKLFKENGYDYAYASGYLGFRPSRHFNIQVGQGKHFFGNGYRSMILSDGSFNYPYLKIESTFWKIKYVNLFTQFQYPGIASELDRVFDKNFGNFHYLSFQANDKLNISLFEAIVTVQGDTAQNRGFDLAYINPVIFYRALESNNGSPDNVILGLEWNYRLLKKLTIYNQWVLDDLNFGVSKSERGYWGNKLAGQVGVKWLDIFGVENLYFLSEFNWARPYTYSHEVTPGSYTHYNQPLAHPWGANFTETVFRGYYRYKRLRGSLWANIGKRGLDDNSGVSMGGDVFQSYLNKPDYDYGHTIGQGVLQNILFVGGEFSFVLNPSTSWEANISVSQRTVKTGGEKSTDRFILFGLRYRLENLYFDF